MSKVERSRSPTHLRIDRHRDSSSLKLQRDRIKQYQKKVSHSPSHVPSRCIPPDRQPDFVPHRTSGVLQIQVILDREHEIARQALAQGDKTRALTALRRRKYQEGLIVKTDSQLETLEELVSARQAKSSQTSAQSPHHGTVCYPSSIQVSSIEFSQIQQSVMHGLQQGNEVLKQIHKEMSIEDVDKLMEETAEAQAYQRVRW